MRYKYILDKNDMIFVVCPIWWYGLPMPMYSFFDEYDFSGKTIIPAVTHEGSRLSGTPDDIAELEPNATVIQDGFNVRFGKAADADADVEAWLDRLGY